MKTVASLLLAALVTTVAATSPADAPATLERALLAVAGLAADAAERSTVEAPVEVAPPAAVVREAPLEMVRYPRGRKVVDVPAQCRESGDYDLVVHFHGAPDTVAPTYRRSGVDAVLVIVNLGIGSGPYEDAFVQDGSLAQLVDFAHEVVQKHCGDRPVRRGRLALSAWSAGYGAVYRVLANKGDTELVDAVLLADGLHAGFLDKYRQQMNEPQMAPFTRFAERAARGEKLFAITHTAIVTPKYASTTETASFLVAKQGLTRTVVDEQGPRPKMRRTSTAQSSDFVVWGYAGGDTDAHCDHLYAIGDTLLPLLAARWSR